MDEQQKILFDLKNKTLVFHKLIKKYPHKDISEYTRLIAALEEFLKYGWWGGEE